MLKKPSQLIIIGGGVSMNEGIKKGLWDKLKDKFTMGLNFSYKYFPHSTFHSYVDKDFYSRNLSELKTLPLIIGKNHKDTKHPALNTVLLTSSTEYKRNPVNGIYKSSLGGLFALSLGIYLLDEGEIYLLGYDYGATINKRDSKGRLITHFYQGKLEHRGIGKENYYTCRGRADKDFGVYKGEKKIKIYNVSLDSKINTFEKISYDNFFKNLDDKIYNQGMLRTEIIEQLRKLHCA